MTTMNFSPRSFFACLLHNSLSLSMVVLLLLVGTGCGTTDAMEEPEDRVLSGVWRGLITHSNPDFNGTLTLSITQTGDVLTGTASWRFSNRGISGILVGNATEEGPFTYTLDFGADGRYQHKAAVNGEGNLSGSWVSERSSGINGSITLERQ